MTPAASRGMVAKRPMLVVHQLSRRERSVVPVWEWHTVVPVPWIRPPPLISACAPAGRQCAAAPAATTMRLAAVLLAVLAIALVVEAQRRGGRRGGVARAGGRRQGARAGGGRRGAAPPR